MGIFFENKVKKMILYLEKFTRCREYCLFCDIERSKMLCNKMLTHMWSCMVLDGPASSCMVLCDLEKSHIGLHCILWSCMVFSCHVYVEKSLNSQPLKITSHATGEKVNVWLRDTVNF